MKDEKNKSIIEEALAEFNLIEENINSNTKEILRSVAKEEITGSLKESLNEDDYDIEDIEDVDADTDSDVDVDVDELPVDDATEESGSEELELDDMDMDSEEEGESLDGEGSEDYGMDMTGASDEEVISVYKKLSGDDEIEVVSSNEVVITDPESGSQYNVKMDKGDSLIDQGEMEASSLEAEGYDKMEEENSEMGDGDHKMQEEEEEDEGVVYEIELSEEEDDVNEETKIGATAGNSNNPQVSDVNKGSDVAAVNTGDIDNKKASTDTETSGDNLEGGFDEEGQNGSGDAHAEHVMEMDSFNGGGSDVEGAAAGLGEIIDGLKKLMEMGGAVGQRAKNALMGLSKNSEMDEEESIEEHIPKAKGEAHRAPAKADIGQPVGAGAKNVKGVKGESVAEKKLATAISKYNTLLGEAKKIKEENEMFRNSLKDFRKSITETAVFNTNLTYATKLFLEHSTTSEEKQNILSRFDEEVSTIGESKKLYKSISSQLGEKTPITESIENKLGSEKSTSQSNQLNETTAYVDPAQKRVLDLMKRTNK